MSDWSKFWEKVGREIQRIIDQLRGKDGDDSGVPAWDKARLATCWAGTNASKRYMNCLSPHMPDTVFRAYLQEQWGRSCDTVHLILANKADGEYGGYTIYGPTWGWQVRREWCDMMLRRIRACRERGMAVVLWLITDDSGAYARELKKNPRRYLTDLRDLGMLEHASTVVLGLELDECYGSGDVGRLAEAARAVYPGKIGTHHTSGRIDYAPYGDLLFYQMKPGASPDRVQAEVGSVRLRVGKPVNAFELDRKPNRALCEAALRGGAYGVGNW